ncbi:MAG: hypothetical protein J6K25_15830 [Thermoguttaceae bacterium]|nr:hypothetical protein [Thermoguttaceae bacterium]MBP3532625.1 hypothetical protein [Thermoguttaceae bacterium]
MKFEKVLPGLIAGRRVRLRLKRERLYLFGDDIRVADREYLRLGKGQFGDLEIVAEYDNPGGKPTLCIRTFTLRRDSLERDDWEFVDDEKRRTSPRCEEKTQ